MVIVAAEIMVVLMVRSLHRFFVTSLVKSSLILNFEQYGNQRKHFLNIFIKFWVLDYIQFYQQLFEQHVPGGDGKPLQPLKSPLKAVQIAPIASIYDLSNFS